MKHKISTLISLEVRRARAERLLRRNRATGSTGMKDSSVLAGQSQMAGRKLLLQAFMMEADSAGGGKSLSASVGGSGTADAARAAHKVSVADEC